MEGVGAPEDSPRTCLAMARACVAAPRLAAAGRKGGMEARAPADASRRPVARVEPNAANALVAGAAGATITVIVEPVEEGAAAV